MIASLLRSSMVETTWKYSYGECRLYIYIRGGENGGRWLTLGSWQSLDGQFQQLRGHSAQIHALHFTKDKARLLTADGDGWIVSWNLASKRPVAVSTRYRSCIQEHIVIQQLTTGL